MLQAACIADRFVEVWDDGDAHSGRTGLDPVFADLVAVSWVHGLDLVAQVVDEAHHGFEVPSCAAQTFPYLTIIFEGSEGDQGIVGGAASEDFGAGVSDVGVS